MTSPAGATAGDVRCRLPPCCFRCSSASTGAGGEAAPRFCPACRPLPRAGGGCCCCCCCCTLCLRDARTGCPASRAASSAAASSQAASGAVCTTGCGSMVTSRPGSSPGRS